MIIIYICKGSKNEKDSMTHIVSSYSDFITVIVFLSVDLLPIMAVASILPTRSICNRCENG